MNSGNGKDSSTLSFVVEIDMLINIHRCLQYMIGVTPVPNGITFHAVVGEDSILGVVGIKCPLHLKDEAIGSNLC